MKIDHISWEAQRKYVKCKYTIKRKAMKVAYKTGNWMYRHPIVPACAYMAVVTGVCMGIRYAGEQL